jgi:diguanylate cyclase (GGDEF)-like protein/PAS domain S-box-containing protein
MQKTLIKVLLIDDDEDSYYLIGNLLSDISRDQYILSWESSYEAASQKMLQNDQDVCLLDYRLGEHSGLELLQIAQEQGFKAPIIFLTGDGDRSVDVAAMQAGAADFLPKGQADASLLERSIRYAIAHTHTLDALRKSEGRYKKLLEAVTNYIYVVKIENGRPVVTFHSPGCQAVTGYTAEEFLENPDLFHSIVYPLDQALVTFQTSRALSGEVVSPFEYRLHHKEGGVHWVRNTLVLQHNEQGDLVGYDSLIADITDRRQMEDNLRYMSQHDAMTGLHNRAFFSEELLRLEECKLYPVSIIIADVDGLKAVNDEQGHLAGDALIKRTAVLLKKTFSSEDVSARLGGDEFGVLMPNIGTAEAENKLAQLRAALGAENQDGKSMPLRISFGLMTVQQGGSLSVGLKQADQRMYQDKATRRTAGQGIRVSKEL